jgi:hypothetical protein
MTKTKQLSELTDAELADELIRRKMEKLGECPTLGQMERSAMTLLDEAAGKPAVAAMFSRMKPENDKPKSCPWCGKRTPVKAKKRARTVQSLAGEFTFHRNYHYCEKCERGFYPVDQVMSLSDDGELSEEFEKRVLDFAVNDTFEEGAARWALHYPQRKISSNLLRRVADRVGAKCTTVMSLKLQQELLPPESRLPETLVVSTDGSMIPMRGEDAWKEAKVATIFREENRAAHSESNRGIISQARYVASLHTLETFRENLRNALHAEKARDAKRVAWVADGAAWNWNLAEELCPNAIQILDYTHAIEHAMDCGKVLLGEENAMLFHWRIRIEELIFAGDMDATVNELMSCLFLMKKSGDENRKQAVNDVIRYFRRNQHRMKYAEFVEMKLPIGSGFVESAHRHVLQKRMKCAGQHWSEQGGHQMAILRAAYRTAGPINFHTAVLRAA